MKLLQIAILSCALSLALASTAQATPDSKKDTGPTTLQLNSEESPTAQLARVERSLGTEQYSEITLEDKSRVQAAVNRIRLRLGDSTTVEGTNPQARTDIFNDQEVINTIMSQAHADSRMVCRRERLTGSNRPTQVCLTVAQRNQMREDSKDAMRTFMNVSPKSPNP